MTRRNGKNPDGVLGIMTIEAPVGLQMEMVPHVHSNRALSAEQLRVEQLFELENFKIEAQREKGKFGELAVEDIREQASFTFQDGVSAIIEKQREIRGEDYEGYIKKFNLINIEALAKDSLGIAAATTENIGNIVYRPIDPPPLPPPPPPPRSLLKMIFG